MPNAKPTKKSIKATPVQKPKGVPRWVRIVSVFVACLLLLIAQTAFWLNRNIFNTTKFTQKATYAITTEDSRLALGNEISDRILDDRPIVKRVAGPKLASLISSLLGTSLAEKSLYDVVQQTNIYLTSSSQKSIGLDLQGIKSGITTVSKVADIFGQDMNIDATRVPDKLVLVNADSIPSFYKEAIAVLWLGPLSLLGALLIFAGLLYKDISDRHRTILIICLSVALAGLFGLSSGPLVRPVILGMLSSPNLRHVYQNIYNEMLTPFNHQMLIMIAISIFVLVATFGYKIYSGIRGSKK